jgi:hypothetical protein
MKALREQLIDRIASIGGEEREYYEDYSDYDLLEDYESLLRANIEEEFANENIDATLYKDPNSNMDAY